MSWLGVCVDIRFPLEATGLFTRYVRRLPYNAGGNVILANLSQPFFALRLSSLKNACCRLSG